MRERDINVIPTAAYVQTIVSRGIVHVSCNIAVIDISTRCDVSLQVLKSIVGR